MTLRLAVAFSVLLGAPVLGQVPGGKGSQPGALDGGVAVQGAVQSCRTCHDNNISDEMTPYTPFNSWVSSMMANSTRDPLFRAALAVANQDVPGIGAWCLRCHSPQAWVRGKLSVPDDRDFDALDHEGVTCDACHRSIVESGDATAPYLFNAQLTWSTTATRFGPYPHVPSPAHSGAQSAFTGSSELCGQCHQVENPLVAWRGLDGGVLGPAFPLDTTYEEWKHSAYSTDAGFASCADCHMPRYVGDDGGTEYPISGVTGPRHKPRRHVFAGGNVWGLAAVAAADPARAQKYAREFEETKKWALANLAAAATLSMRALSDEARDGGLPLEVTVTNLSGHKLPTGYGDGRRVTLEVSVGVDAGWSALRTYRTVHGRFDAGPGEHLALHDTIFEDTRLWPKGFVPTRATQSVPSDFFGNATPGQDVVRFSVPALADAGTVRVSIRLLYASTDEHYVRFLREANHSNDAGEALHELFSTTADAAQVSMVRADAEFPVTRAPAVALPQSVAPKGCGCQSNAASLGALALVFALRRSRRRG